MIQLRSHSQRVIVPPWDLERRVQEFGSDDDRQVGAAVEMDMDLTFGDFDIGGRIDQIAEDIARLRLGVTAHAACQL